MERNGISYLWGGILGRATIDLNASAESYGAFHSSLASLRIPRRGYSCLFPLNGVGSSQLCISKGNFKSIERITFITYTYSVDSTHGMNSPHIQSFTPE